MLLVARDAAAHADVAFFPEGVALGDGAVTGLAVRASVEVRSVAELDKTRDLVHPHPRHLLPRVGILLELPDRGRAGVNGGMTQHALRDRGNALHVSGIGIGVTIGALQSQRGVLAMAERDRLCGYVVLLRPREKHAREQSAN